MLNNVRLIIYAKRLYHKGTMSEGFLKDTPADISFRNPLGQPSLLLWLVVPWVKIFPNSSLILGFHRLISTMNQFQPLLLPG